MAASKNAIPKTIGGCADKLFKLREEKSRLNKQIKALDEHEKAIKNHIINTLPKSQATGVAGKLARVTVVTKTVPTVKDWEKVWKYISRQKAWDLLQRRLNEKAVKDRWEDGKKVSGVEPFEVVTISLKKAD